jgi:arylsulfatase
MSPLPAQAAAALGGRGWDLMASMTRAATDEGVIYATGTENAGFSFFVQDSRLVFDYNAFNDHEILVSDRDVPVGDTVVGAQVRRTGRRTGTVELLIDGVPCGAAELPLLMTVISSVGPIVGFDHGSAVSTLYEGPFPFSGRLHRIDIDADPEQKHGDAAEIAAAELRAESARQ